MHADFFGQAHHVHARRTACADQGEVTRVVTALDRYAADAVDHVQVDQGGDAKCRAFHTDAQRFGDIALDGVQRGLAVQADTAAQQCAVGQVAKCQVGVGDRGFAATLAVAHRPRHGAGAARSDLEHAKFVQVGDGATAGTQGLHLDHRHADALAQEVHVLAEVGASGVGQGDIE